MLPVFISVFSGLLSFIFYNIVQDNRRLRNLVLTITPQTAFPTLLPAQIPEIPPDFCINANDAPSILNRLFSPLVTPLSGPEVDEEYTLFRFLTRWLSERSDYDLELFLDENLDLIFLTGCVLALFVIILCLFGCVCFTVVKRSSYNKLRNGHLTPLLDTIATQVIEVPEQNEDDILTPKANIEALHVFRMNEMNNTLQQTKADLDAAKRNARSLQESIDDLIARAQGREAVIKQKDDDSKALAKANQALSIELDARDKQHAQDLQRAPDNQLASLEAQITHLTQQLDDKIETLQTETARADAAVLARNELQSTLDDTEKMLFDAQLAALSQGSSTQDQASQTADQSPMMQDQGSQMSDEDSPDTVIYAPIEPVRNPSTPTAVRVSFPVSKDQSTSERAISNIQPESESKPKPVSNSQDNNGKTLESTTQNTTTTPTNQLSQSKWAIPSPDPVQSHQTTSSSSTKAVAVSATDSPTQQPQALTSEQTPEERQVALEQRRQQYQSTQIQHIPEFIPTFDEYGVRMPQFARKADDVPADYDPRRTGAASRIRQWNRKLWMAYNKKRGREEDKRGLPITTVLTFRAVPEESNDAYLFFEETGSRRLSGSHIPAQTPTRLIPFEEFVRTRITLRNQPRNQNFRPTARPASQQPPPLNPSAPTFVATNPRPRPVSLPQTATTRGTSGSGSNSPRRHFFTPQSEPLPHHQPRLFTPDHFFSNAHFFPSRSLSSTQQPPPQPQSLPQASPPPPPPQQDTKSPQQTPDPQN